MGGAQNHNNWMSRDLAMTDKNGFDDSFEEDPKAKALDPFQWEDDSSNSQDSVFQNSMDGSSGSQPDQNQSLFTSPETSPAMNGSKSVSSSYSASASGKERLVIRFRRVSQRYYMVLDSPDSSCINYGKIRTDFEDYGVPTEFLPTPKKSTQPKVHRCKTCRKVFNKVSSLQAHRKTHITGHGGGGGANFDKSRSKGFTAVDFAKRFSRDKTVSKGDPNLLGPSEYAAILSKVSPHPTDYPGYVNNLYSPMPLIKPGSRFAAGEDEFQVNDFIGEGGFARVFSATWLNGPPADRDTVLKVQMPANDWEWYCLNQVHLRFSDLSHPLKECEPDYWEEGFMSTPRCFSYRDGSVMNTRYQRMGTLLDLVNLTKNADKNIIEPIAIYLTSEVLGLLEILHSMKLVHADIKPDNFLVRHTPSTRSESSLQLIDFGKAIDLELEGDKEPVIETSEGRQGKFHLDYFGIAGCAYCLLFGKYIEVGTVKSKWVVKGQFKRWWQVKVWTQFFDEMLNPKDDGREFLPSLLKWRKRFMNLFDQNEDLRTGLTRAKETIDMKYMEKWRRSAL